jgi:DNA-binding MarR family transcriptional regulator
MTSVQEPGRPVADKIVAAIDRLARGQRAHRQVVATAHRLSPLQLELLATVGSGLPAEPTVGQLARELAVAQPTVTDSVRTLEGKGLLARESDPTDRRRSRVTLTAAGAALVDQLQAGDRNLVDAVSGLGDARQGQLLEGLLDLIAAMVHHGVIDVARTCTTCQHHRLSPDGTHHCTLLQVDLPAASLQVNCPEHLAVASHRS